MVPNFDIRPGEIPVNDDAWMTETWSIRNGALNDERTCLNLFLCRLCGQKLRTTNVRSAGISMFRVSITYATTLGFYAEIICAMNFPGVHKTLLKSKALNANILLRHLQILYKPFSFYFSLIISSREAWIQTQMYTFISTFEHLHPLDINMSGWKMYTYFWSLCPRSKFQQNHHSDDIPG